VQLKSFDSVAEFSKMIKAVQSNNFARVQQLVQCHGAEISQSKFACVRRAIRLSLTPAPIKKVLQTR
jgi:hypothetical protein